MNSFKWNFKNFVCKIHCKEQVQVFCDECCIPLCSACIASNDHEGHMIIPFYQASEKMRADFDSAIKE